MESCVRDDSVIKKRLQISMRTNHHMYLPTTIALLLTSCRVDVEVTKTGDSVVDAEALTIYGGQHSAINGQAFQQDALKTFQGC